MGHAQIQETPRAQDTSQEMAGSAGTARTENVCALGHRVLSVLTANDGSRMNREIHVGFHESLGVKLPWAIRLGGR